MPVFKALTAVLAPGASTTLFWSPRAEERFTLVKVRAIELTGASLKLVQTTFRIDETWFVKESVSLDHFSLAWDQLPEIKGDLPANATFYISLSNNDTVEKKIEVCLWLEPVAAR
jgi:hypothetical protein